MKRHPRLRVLDEDTATPAQLGDVDASRELPPLHEATLDWDAVDCVLADLDDFAAIQEIQGRSSRDAPSPYTDIVRARDDLVAGHIHGLQVTYTFADQTWVDTLLRETGGARLLRMIATT